MAHPVEEQAAQHIDALYALACRLTRNPTAAEDLVQDTLVKAMRARDQFREGTNLKAWLFRIQTNTFFNKHQRLKLESRVTEGSDAGPLAPGWMGAATMRQLTNPEEAALLPIVEGEIRRALEELPEEYRLAVMLCDVEEFSYEEMATIMECPVGTVMSRLHRGRKLLQKSLYAHAVALGIIEEKKESAEPTSLATYRARKEANGS